MEKIEEKDSLTEGTSLLYQTPSEPAMVESSWKYGHLLVDILAGLFGIGAWLSVNAIYTQLPLLVMTAPEKWALPSYLSVLIQIANIGPILFSLLKRYAPNMISDSILITVIMLLGSASLLLLAEFYNYKMEIFDDSHSVALFVLMFCVALVGCTSSVLFIPFMNNFPETHLISYLVGEGLSGFIPSIVSLIQGVGVGDCVNKTLENGTIIRERDSHPLFGPSEFFVSMFFLMCISTISFLFLIKLPPCQSVRSRKKSLSITRSSTLDTADNNSLHLDNPIPISNASTLSHSLYIGLLFLQAIISMFANGILPSIQTYSCLPYGNFDYHLAVNLANMANPLACFVAFFLPRTSIKSISIMSTLAAVTVVYNIVSAVMSPHPPLQDQALGTTINVASWVLCIGLVSYLKLSIAALFRREGGHGLFWYGAVTQAGAATGSVVSFVSINNLDVFTIDNPCKLS